MAPTIDELNIQIASDSSKATRALTSLIKKLEKLKGTLAGTSGLNITIANSFNKVTQSANNTTSAVKKYDNALSGLTETIKEQSNKLDADSKN